MSQNNPERKPTPIGQEVPRTPADRVRMIQDLQRASEAAQVQQPPVRTPAPAAQPQAPKSVSDAFAVKAANPVAQALTAKTTRTEAATYAQLQRSASALFGAPSELEITGNPWKVISFADALPGLFDEVGDAEVKVPENAVQTEHGALFEVGLSPKGADAPKEKRAVLVNAQGQLAGAECKTPKDATRLLATAKWLLPVEATEAGATWKVSEGRDSAFTLELSRGAGKASRAEFFALDNFGRVTTSGRRSDLDVASYFLDRFEAAV